ncbi:protein phosphatase 2C domain-containing protein [Streptomyces sp. NPDC102360]|uniref:protein phosphatase 2C domain-containing protein n=1 Tax=Streptomyces sp. NPDC102360 TaxID=3366160 RepID=UPI00381D6075
MSQQGERPTGHPAQGDDWWGKLYDDEVAAGDTGPAPTPDTLDDRFTSAKALAPPHPPTAPGAGAVGSAPGGLGADLGALGADPGAPGAEPGGSGPDSGELSAGPGSPGTAPGAPGAEPGSPESGGPGPAPGAPGAEPGSSGPGLAAPGPELGPRPLPGDASLPGPRRVDDPPAPPPPETGHTVYPETGRVWDAGGPPQSPPAPRRPLDPPPPREESGTPREAPPHLPVPPAPAPLPPAPSADAASPWPEGFPPPPEGSRFPREAPPEPPEAPRRAPVPAQPEAPPAPPGAPRVEAAPALPDTPPLPPGAVPSPQRPEAASPPLEAVQYPPDAPPLPPEAAPPPGGPSLPPEAASPPGGIPAAPGTVPSPADAPSPPSGTVPSPADAPSPPSGTVPSPADVTRVGYVGDGPPTYEAEPTALPLADPEELEGLVADTVLDGARCGVSTLRAVSVRGDSARYRGEPRRDSLLTARFGSGASALILVAMATGARATPGAHRAAAEVCEWIGRAVGLSHARLAEDVRAGRRGDLKSGLHRLTDRSLGRLRAGATEQGLDPEEYAATLRCLLLPADPACRTRVFFGAGGGGLFRLRDGEWRDIEPSVPEQAGAAVVGFGSSPPAETPDGDRLTMDLDITTPPSPYEPAAPSSPGSRTSPDSGAPTRDAFRFRASVARPGDTLLLCSPGLAEPLRGEPDLAHHLANRWADADPPGLAAFLADTQVRVKGYADDRTAAAVWEA